jgi:hypothetical protein
LQGALGKKMPEKLAPSLRMSRSDCAVGAVPPKPGPEQSARWSTAIEALTWRIGQLELEASYAFCRPARAALLRQEASRLTARLEALKGEQMSQEGLA